MGLFDLFKKKDNQVNDLTSNDNTQDPVKEFFVSSGFSAHKPQIENNFVGNPDA